MSTNELTSKVRELKELKTMAEELAAEIEAIESELKAEMTARDTEEMIVDIFKVRYTTVTSSRIDTTAIKKELPEIAERYTKKDNLSPFFSGIITQIFRCKSLRP